MKSGERVRNVLIILLKLNNAANASVHGVWTKSAKLWWRIRRTLHALIDSPAIVALPALRNLAEITLLNLESIKKGDSSISSSTLSSELDAIQTANVEITSILPSTETALETLIYNYISDSLQQVPGKFSQEPLNRLLGYSFTDRMGNRPYSTSTHSPHIQRAREIMGPAVSESMEVCRGFWRSVLSVENFFALVSAHQAYGGVESEGFKKELRRIEGEIEEGLRAAIKRTTKGFPYRFGVDAPGLKKADGGNTYEDQMFTLEAQNTLRYIQAHREKR